MQREAEAKVVDGQVDSGRPRAPVFLLQVNNQKMAIPYKVNEHLRVTMRSHRLYLITNFELVVSFDGRNNAGTCEWGQESRRDVSGIGEGNHVLG